MFIVDLAYIILFQEMFGTISEFMKLEKIEIGGIKGKVLSMQVLQLYEEFLHVFREFSRHTYDSLDPMNHVRHRSNFLVFRCTWRFKL